MRFSKRKRSTEEAAADCLEVVGDEDALEEALAVLLPASSRTPEEIRSELLLFRLFWARVSAGSKLQDPSPLVEAMERLFSQEVGVAPDGRSARDSLASRVAAYAEVYEAPTRSTGDRYFRMGQRFGEFAGIERDDMAPLMPVVVNQIAVTQAIGEYLSSVRLVPAR